MEMQMPSRDLVLTKMESGETASLLLALAEISGDVTYLSRWGQYIQGPTSEQARFPAEVERDIREHLAAAIEQHGLDCSSNDPQLWATLCNQASGQPLPPEEHKLLYKEMGISADVHVDWSNGRPAAADDFTAVIIGGGLSGIAMAIRLKRLGIPFVLYDKNEKVGGTWLVNTYPGCGVDIASHYFSYSFEQNPNWSRYYAKQPEILAYLEHCVDKYGLEDSLRLETEVLSTVFDETLSRWVLRVRDNAGAEMDVHANVVVSAVGQLSLPKTPTFPQQKTFRGATFHSAEWDHSVDVAGKRVLLIGGGASANQIGPAIAPIVESLTILQRNPHWIIRAEKYQDHVSSDKQWLLASIPAYRRWFRTRTVLSMNDVMRPAVMIDPDWDWSDGTINAASEIVRKNLIDYIVQELGPRQDLVGMLIPKYPPFLKRMLRDNGWYRMLTRPNVNLVTSDVANFTSDGVVDQDGVLHPADVVVFATGFQAAKMLSSANFIGRNGVSIRDVWGEDDPRAYLGIAVPEFPNLFVLYGPNTNIGTGGSIFFQAECQTGYIAQIIRDMIEKRVHSVEVRREVFTNYNTRLDERLDGMVWGLPIADTWYRNKHGRVTTNMPWTSFEYWEMTRRATLQDYVAVREAPALSAEFEVDGPVK